MPYGSILADNIQSSTANTPPVFKDGNGTETGVLCRAWVNFNGTGTVAIRASFNVSSITDNGTGKYTMNFTNAMSDTNYSASQMTDCYEGATSGGNILGGVCTWQGSTKTTSAFQFQTSRAQASGSASVIGPSIVDMATVCVQIFR